MEFCASNGRLQPGFRFHPTDVELVMYYLKRKVLGKRLEPEVVTEVDIYQFHPMDLRELSCLKKDLNWYFFCPRGKKYGSGDRTNRATSTGYWKATGNDRIVSYEHRTVGKIKTLIFHQGKPPKGERTDWVMHEFKLDDKKLADVGVSQDSYVLCKVFKKSGLGPKNAEQYGAPFVEEEWSNDDEIPNCAQMVPVDVQNQSISAVTNVFPCTNACPTFTSEQVVDQAPPPTPNADANIVLSSNVLIPTYGNAVHQAPTPMLIAADWASCSMVYSGAVSVDQSPAPTSNAAANLAFSSKDPIPNCTAAANPASSSKGLVPNYNAAVDQATTAMPILAVWPSSSKLLFPNYYDPAAVAAVQVPTSMPGVADIASTSSMGGHVPYYDDDEIFTTDEIRVILGGLEDLDKGNVQGNESDWRSFFEGGMGLTDLDDFL